MYHFVANSSGETSGYLTYYILYESGISHKDIVVFFQNTGEEDPASLIFLHEQEKHWNFKYVWLEYDFPEGFEKAVLIHKPTYNNLEKFGFAGMYNTDLLDKIRWDESEIKQDRKQVRQLLDEVKERKKNGVDTLFDISEHEIIEMVADYTRCLNDFYKVFGKTRNTLGERHKQVNFKTASRKGIPMLKMHLYLNAVRYVKQLPYVVPNPAHRFSTGNLKIKTGDSYIKKHNLYPLIKYIGIRHDEEKRYWGNLTSETKKDVQNSMPLYDNKIDSQFIKKFWDKQPFQLKIRDKKYLGNCTYCYLKTKLKRIRAAQERPESFYRLKIIENAAGDYMKRGQPAEEILLSASKIVVTDNDLKNDTEPQMACMCG